MIFLVLSGRVESIEGVDGFWRFYRRILAWKIMTASDRVAALKRGGPGIRKKTRNEAPGEDLNRPQCLMNLIFSDPTCFPRTSSRSAKKSPND